MLGEATWSICEQGSCLRIESLAGLLPIGNGSKGLRLQSTDGDRTEAVLFAASMPEGDLPTLGEQYTRGCDHVTLLATNPSFPYRARLVWSAYATDGMDVVITLEIALQTQLLDTQPVLQLASYESGAAWREENGVWLNKASSKSLLRAVVIHSSDREETRVVPEGPQLQIELAPPFLEKGVIRTFRVAAVVGLDVDHQHDVAAALQRFESAAAPLTS